MTDNIKIGQPNITPEVMLSTLTNSPYVTNRILEIPQNVKLELSSGTLTLKSGSKVYVPNGFEADGVTPHFDIVITDADKSITPTNTGSNLVIYWIDNGVATIVNVLTEYCVSGASAPGNGYYFWFDTTNNIIKFSLSRNNVWVEKNISLPFCLGTTAGSSGMTSIDQIFNIFGYIGSTVFMLPDVKVQDVYGRNENGTYINYIRKNNTVKILTRTSIALTNWMIVCSVFTGEIRDIYYVRNFKIVKKVPTSETNYTVLFNEGDGCFYYTDAGTTPVKIDYSVIPLVKNISCDANGRVTSFTSCDVNTVNTYSRSELSEMGMSSSKYEDWTLGASGSTYTAPANGYVTLQKQATEANKSISIYTLADDTHTRTGYRMYSSATGQYLLTTLPVKKGETVYVAYTATSTTGQYFRFVYAEGEV